MPDALRGVADHRCRDRARRGRAPPARVAIARRPARRSRARAVAGVGDRRVSGQQQDHGGRLVRLERVFRRREPGTGSSLDGVATGLGTASCNSSGSVLPWAACAAAGLTIWEFRRSRRPGPADRRAGPGRRGPAAVVRLSARPSGSDPLRRATGRRVRRHHRPRCEPAATASARSPRGSLSSPLPSGRPIRSTPPPASIRESQRDARNAVARRAVTAYLVAHWDRQPIMMSMGSLGHYMHDLSQCGFRDRRFPARGQRRDLEIRRAPSVPVSSSGSWLRSGRKVATSCIGRAGSMCGSLKGYARVAEGGGVALYQRLRRRALARLRRAGRQKRKPKVKFVVQPPRSSLSPRNPASSRPFASAFCQRTSPPTDEVAGQTADAAKNRRAGGGRRRRCSAPGRSCRRRRRTRRLRCSASGSRPARRRCRARRCRDRAAGNAR